MSKKPAATFPADLHNESDADELRRLWAVLPEQANSLTHTDTDAAWEALRLRAGIGTRADGAAVTSPAPEAARDATPEPSPAPAEVGRRAGLRAALRAAATVVLALGVTAAWYSVPVRHAAGAGEQTAVTLPDGSQVALNAGSSVTYRRGFSWLPGVPATARTVRLRGEAFFTVTPSSRTFRVEAGGLDVRVLGTRFNVRARAASTARVDVEEGRVQVSSPGLGRSLILREGEAASVDRASGELEASEVELPRVGAWRSGGLVLEDAALESVLAELSLRFDAPVTLADGVRNSARLNLYYAELGSLESVVSDLATQQGLRYRATRTGWELF
jgi:ferric-dicitrate binding protein FerR (iron transport regulator)